MTKPLPPYESWGQSWQENGWNNCLRHAADALDYLTNNDRPIGGEQHYNAIDLESTAYDVRRTLDAMKEYRKRCLTEFGR